MYGPNGLMRDLLIDYAKPTKQQCYDDNQADIIHDVVFGTQLNNVQELRVHTPEKAAFYLDSALALRNYSMFVSLTFYETIVLQIRTNNDATLIYSLHLIFINIKLKAAKRAVRSLSLE